MITLRANQIVSGLALTIFAGAAGLSSYIANDFSLGDNPARFSFGPANLFGLEDLPVVGPIVFGQNILVYFSWVVRGRGGAVPLAHAAGARAAGSW